ncbi:MAG: 2-C-methyl-D-erythritol 4-phosphate cytidylyltransferase [Idiomarina sp.]|uniref:2-C-methyl-D-erythritol 4-phosphate cytidylyltransferase n=1 Tax=Idiomarina sp. TaxID=1874361 RepID=UPI000C106F6C|nr:2-C-methyl-D-erythritol 4-phosphate cytidylyltransferase [Idiomarina sp.]MAK71557.1 2-C-methyl-D-erythritol 4-phosphate cytidylyltransferase [Idiomarinaceae bacterium]MBL4742904.1 2-C-methyl-D-erythritol 4-phosphate cytidylyltransferase [Idiomarina sp.]MBT42905.1 2-C-methyl-D-erythritol 4-phosphate cytidylyltransferase [Idiomarina sp.]PHQ73044.1 MAG: 2-C-methyl-D-erythritol 4-phosphate cytidylyltransferase [Idiomarina sp.]
MPAEPKIAAVIPAAGSGSRMRSDVPKQYLAVHGKTLLQYAVEAVQNDPRVAHVFIAVNEQQHPIGAKSVADISFVAGGKTRAESVLSGVLHAINQGYSHVLVHDAARPGLPASILTEVIDVGVSSDHGAIVAMPVRDSLKRSEPDQTIISQSVARDDLWQAQTPQIFAAELLADAISEVGIDNPNLTDEASAMEAMGYHPRLVMGSLDNIKVTHPDDLRWVATILKP